MLNQETDEMFLIKEANYTIKDLKSAYLLKKIKIPKQALCYAFLGGMWYTKNSFSLKQDISVPYPFSTYYTIKIPDKIIDDVCLRITVFQ